MSKAAELAALISSQSALSNRNLFINGAMQVAQRGADIDGVANGGLCTDRFKFRIANTDNLVINLDQSTDTPAGFNNSLKVSVGTAESAIAADEFFSFGQTVEAQNCQRMGYGSSSAKKLTLSFYVKSSVTGTYAISLFQSDASSSPDRRYHSKTYTINSANTWEYKTVTINPNTNDAIANDNGVGLRVDWTLSAGTNYTSGSNDTWGDSTNWMVGHNASWITTSGATFFLTGAQLEIGEQATPFEHRSFEDELQRCQRYTYVPRNDSTSTADGSAFSIGYCNSGPVGVYCAVFPVPMRDIPTLTTTSSSGALEQAYHNNTVTSHNATDMTYVASISGNQKGWFTISGASFSGGEGAHCRYTKGVFSDGTSKDDIIVFSAEL